MNALEQARSLLDYEETNHLIHLLEMEAGHFGNNEQFRADCKRASELLHKVVKYL